MLALEVPQQARCFRLFFETWADDPAVAGCLVWEWRNHPNHDSERGYVPCKNEGSMKEIRAYFARPPKARPPATGPAATGPASRPATSSAPARLP